MNLSRYFTKSICRNVYLPILTASLLFIAAATHSTIALYMLAICVNVIVGFTGAKLMKIVTRVDKRFMCKVLAQN